MTERFVDRWPLVFMAVLLVQAAILSALRTGTDWDGAEQLLYSQYVDLGYGRSQPPLYTWLVIASQSVLGVTQIAQTALKFLLLGLGGCAVYGVARRLGHPAGVATGAMLSLILVVELSWEAQRIYTHTVLIFALTGAVTLGYLALCRDRDSTGRFVLLGVLFGAVVLAKYNGLLIVLALVLADLSHPGARLFARRQSLWVWLAFAALTLPHGLWAVQNQTAALSLGQSFVQGDIGFWARRAEGAVQFAIAALGVFLLPALALGLLAMPGSRLDPRPAPSTEAQVLLRFGLIFIGLSLAVTLASGSTVARMRWLVPAVVPLFPVLFGALLARRPRALPRFAGACTLLGAVVTSGQWYEATRLNPITTSDYLGFAEAMEAANLPPDIVTLSYPHFTNLRLVRDRAVIAPDLPRLDWYAETSATALWPAGNEGARTRVLALAHRAGLCPEPGRTSVEITLRRTERHGDSPMTALPLMRCD